MHICPACQGQHQDRTTFTPTMPGECQALAIDRTTPGGGLQLCRGLLCFTHGCHRQQDHAPQAVQPAPAAAP